MPSPTPDPPPVPLGEQEPRDRWLFLLSGGLLVVALLLAIGRERRWGEPLVTLQLAAPRADGLQEGMEVRLSGMPIGRLEALSLQNDARVAGTLRVNARYRHLIGPRSRARTASVGLVGPTFLSLSPDPVGAGRSNATPQPVIVYEPPPDLNLVVADLANTGQELDRTLALATNVLKTQVPSSLGSLQQSMGKLSGSMGDLTAMSKTVGSETRATVPSVRQLTATLQQESNRLGPAARRTLARADQTLERADQTAANASRASKQAELLLQQTRPVLVPTLDNLREIT
ncbi:MAG: MlaD family protein, partial [Cyanobacteriota bacterium]|nr:MlaD family protein [Cyanobacteriota bacterium]